MKIIINLDDIIWGVRLSSLTDCIINCVDWHSDYHIMNKIKTLRNDY